MAKKKIYKPNKTTEKEKEELEKFKEHQRMINEKTNKIET